MQARLKLLGIAMIVSGIFGLGVAGYTLMKTMEGANSLQAFSKAQEVKGSIKMFGPLPATTTRGNWLTAAPPRVRRRS